MGIQFRSAGQARIKAVGSGLARVAWVSTVTLGLLLIVTSVAAASERSGDDMIAWQEPAKSALDHFYGNAGKLSQEEAYVIALTPAAVPRVVMMTYDSSTGDLIYCIDGDDFAPYDCQSDGNCCLTRVTSPPAPSGWNQPDFVPDGSWRPGTAVWWHDWDRPDWQFQQVGCDSPIGLVDARDNPVGKSGTTHLYRHTFHLTPPIAGMEVRRAVLGMWSDNSSEWWWDGRSIHRDGQGYMGQIDVSMHIRKAGGTHVLAIQSSNDYACYDSDYCNPHGTAFRLVVIWALPGAQTKAYLPLMLQRCQRYKLIEEFDSAEGFTWAPERHAQLIQVDTPHSRVMLNVSRKEIHYFWRTIPELNSGDFLVIIRGALTRSHNNCGVAVAIRSGRPVVDNGEVHEPHIISESHPGVMIALTHFGVGCGSEFDHIHAQWVYPDGKEDTTHHDFVCNYTNGTIIPIRQGIPYTAVLEVRSSQGTAALSVFDASGSPIGTLSGVAGFQDSFGPLDTLVLGCSLSPDHLQNCSAWIDSVRIYSLALCS